MIKTVTEMEFLVDFPWVQVNVFGAYARDARLIGFYRDGIPSALAVVKKSKTHLEIMDMFRNPDVVDDDDDDSNDDAWGYSELLDEILGISGTLSLPVSYSFLVGHEDFNLLDRLLSDKGFSRDADKRLVLCIADQPTKERWYDFLDRRGNMLVERLARKGLVNIAYKDLTPEQREYVHSAAQTDFGWVVEPGRTRLPVDGDNCFFVFYKGCLVSFCLVFRVSPTQIIVEYLGAKEQYRNTGAFLMPLITFITNTFNYDVTQSITFVYHVGNSEMESIAGRMLPIVIESAKTRAYYYLVNNPPPNA